MLRLPTLVLLAVLAGACASSGTTAASADETAPRRDRTTIQAEEMQRVQALNLYEVVQRIHPEWLKPRNTSTTGRTSGLSASTDTDVQVYIDAQRAGNAEILKTMAVRSAATMRFYSAADAQVKFGSGNLNGAIEVVSAGR
jgi:hypothetical protein